VHFASGQPAAKADFLGGHVDVYISSVGDALEIIASGDGRAVGVAAARRSELLPNVPTFAEQGIAVEELGMRGYAVPAGVPSERVRILADALQEIITSTDHQETLRRLSLGTEYMDPDAYTAWFRAQIPTVERINELSKSDN
jgi:tripartite-type tricarboxylate transporter receptor subunit TctC